MSLTKVPSSMTSFEGTTFNGEVRSYDSADQGNFVGGASGTANRIQIRGASHSSTPNVITMDTNGSEKFRLDSSGNLGLGVTPSAWSQGKAFELAQSGYGVWNGTNSSYLFANTYFNGGFKYANTGVQASHYYQYQGQHVWSTAPSGTAGNAITFTNAMTLDSSGNLTISGSTATKASGTTWANPSDQRLKDNIRDYEKGLVELMQVRVREWEYNGKGGTTEGLKGLGVVADEIETILPNTVETYEAKLEETDEEVTTIKKFDATEITWLLVNAVKELTQRIEALEAR